MSHAACRTIHLISALSADGLYFVTGMQSSRVTKLVGEMVQRVQFHGTPVCHGEKQEEEESEVEQEIEGTRKKRNQKTMRMSMEVTRHVRGLEPM